SCWLDLKGDDAARAYQAIYKLASAPSETVALLSKHLHPVVTPDLKLLNQLIGDLDNDTFATREEATKKLEALAAIAEPALRLALEQSPSAEATRRINQVLAKLGASPTGDRLRYLRSIEGLELIATPEARKLLSKLASGAPGAWLTRDAKGALERNVRRVRDRSP